MDIDAQKARVRREYRQRLALLSAEEIKRKSSLVTAGALQLPPLQAVQTVGAYASVQKEVATWELLPALLSKGKRLVLPVVKSKTGLMEFREVEDLAGMLPGMYGILEPKGGEICLPETIDLLFIPGMAFDRQGGRLGRGKGYYDRFLRSLRPEAVKVGLAFSEQLSAAVPRDEKDVCMNMIIIEEEVILCNTEGKPEKFLTRSRRKEHEKFF